MEREGESNIDRENLLIPINPYFKQTGTSSNIGGGMYGQIGEIMILIVKIQFH